jgi:hypothetical protein
MSTDYGEKEREFLASLEADTGRDLAAWMAAIQAQALSHRNEIIDWLRQQGFTFSRASWLERIHHNDGKPIYADRPAGPRREASKPAGDEPPPSPARAPPALRIVSRTDAPAPRPQPMPPPPTTPTAAPPLPADASALDELLAKAKAYRPLAQYLMQEIARTVHGTAFTPAGGFISVQRGGEFAVIVVSPRELRLGLALGERAVEPPLERAKFTNPTTRIAPTVTHMIVLTDARQVDARLLALVNDAAGRSGR